MRLKLILLFSLLLTSGKTFSQWTLAADFGTFFVNSILTVNDTIYAGTSSGIYRSDNNGSNWTQFNSGLGNTTNVQTLAVKDNIIFAGTSSGGIFYSTNNGSNWIQSNQGIGQLNIKVLITDQNRVYAGLIFAGIFSSTNNGLSWTRFGLGEGDLLNSLSYNSNAFFAGITGTIYKSTNQGVNWALAITGLTNSDVRTIVHTDNKSYCGTYGGGAFVSTNSGDLWSGISSGLPDQRILTMTALGDNVFASVNGYGIYLLDGAGWVSINQGLADTMIVSISYNDDFIFAGSTKGKVWKRPLSEIITGIVQTNFSIPEKFTLHQNYPNPFNPSTVISYSIKSNIRSQTSNVKLIIFDVSGKEIATLLNEKKSPGRYEVDFSGTNFPSGIYFYRLEVDGNVIDTKRMVFVK